MLNNEAEPLMIAFKREVAKMRDRDASDLEIQAMLEFVEQSIRWREELSRKQRWESTGTNRGSEKHQLRRANFISLAARPRCSTPSEARQPA